MTESNFCRGFIAEMLTDGERGRLRSAPRSETHKGCDVPAARRSLPDLQPYASPA